MQKLKELFNATLSVCLVVSLLVTPVATVGYILNLAQPVPTVAVVLLVTVSAWSISYWLGGVATFGIAIYAVSWLLLPSYGIWVAQAVCLTGIVLWMSALMGVLQYIFPVRPLRC